jgi:hypothetical protein
MWKARIIDEAFLGGAKLVLFYEQDGRISVLQSDGKTIKTYEPGVMIDDFTMVIPTHAGLEAILNALLERGVKPKEQSRVEGVLEATKAHLEDMRRLVFEPVITETRIQEAGK